MKDILIHGPLRYLLFSSICVYVLLANAQEDTVRLSEVEIKGDPMQLFTLGNRLRQIEVREDGQSLSEVLSLGANLYFKSYGHQQLSTITMRGTSANQTNVLWRGVPVNYPTLGLMDFSQWPAWFLSSVDLQSGSGGALFGSGSIGGTVLLDSNGDLSDSKPGVTARADIGSFGYSFLGAKGTYQMGNLLGRTKIYRRSIENDFTYEHNGEEWKQNNAGSRDLGIQQQLQWDVRDHQFVFDGMITENDREVQPTDGVISDDHLETSNVRLSLSHQYMAINGSFNTTLAYITNGTLYNDSLETISGQYSLVSAYAFELGKSITARVGINSNLYLATSANYDGDLDDLRIGIFASISSDITSYWRLSLNLRQSFFKDRYPFNPAFNQSITLIENNKHSLILNQSISSGFRFPTLNDLYWSPGGNPDLKPESSLNADFGVKWTVTEEMFSWGISSNIFKIWSRDYILWIPGQAGIWSPENLQDVDISGLESEVFLNVFQDRFSGQIKGAYSFTQSLNQTGNNAGNQLSYVPVHQANFSTRATWKNWSFFLAGNATGRRYTTLDQTLAQSVGGYFLLDAGLSREIKLKEWEMSIGFKTYNLLNKDYENLINRSMPGRNYQLYLMIKP